MSGRILVLGSGNFGSCLSDHLADAGASVYLWSRSKDVVESLNTTRRNPKYLQEHEFSENITAIGPEFPSKDLLTGVDVVLFAIPTQNLRRRFYGMPSFPAISPGDRSLTRGIPRAILKQVKGLMDGVQEQPLFIFVNKGIETGTQALTLEIIADECGNEVARQSVYLVRTDTPHLLYCHHSGPSFAKEIIKRQPTQVSVASLSAEHAEKAAAVFHQPWFRCYTNDDPIGVELAGAGKNVYALAAGAAAGLGYENNTRAGLITRCLAEMTRVGVAYGASPITFLSLAGVGDLFLTCNSEKSRNFTVGYRMGKGESLDHIIETLGSVAEGVSTAKGYMKIIERVGVDAPVAKAVYEVLYEGAVLNDVVQQILNRPRTVEHDLPPSGTSPVENLLTRLKIKQPWGY